MATAKNHAPGCAKMQCITCSRFQFLCGCDLLRLHTYVPNPTVRIYLAWPLSNVTAGEMVPKSTFLRTVCGPILIFKMGHFNL